MFVGGGIAPVLMGALIAAGGGWSATGGYALCFLTLAGCALGGAALQLFTRRGPALAA